MEARQIRPGTFVLAVAVLALAMVIDLSRSGWVLLPILAVGDFLIDWLGVDLRPGRHRQPR